MVYRIRKTIGKLALAAATRSPIAVVAATRIPAAPGPQISSTLDGRWVKTIVLIRPICDGDPRVPANAEKPAAC